MLTFNKKKSCMLKCYLNTQLYLFQISFVKHKSIKMENIMEVQKQIKENASEVNDFLKVYFLFCLGTSDINNAT